MSHMQGKQRRAVVFGARNLGRAVIALLNGQVALAAELLVMAERGSYRLNPELALSTDAAGFEATAQRALSLPPGADCHRGR